MSLELFLDSIKSNETKKRYTYSLQKYGLNKLEIKDRKIIEQEIIEFITKMKKEGMTLGAINNYIAPIKTYYAVNDVLLNVRKIDRFLPSQTRKRKDRAYTHSEISKLLEVADPRMKVVILLMASSGIRIGSIPDIKLKHLVDNTLTVYEGSSEEYFTFTTQETLKHIDKYIDMRSRYGEKLNDNSWLIREQFNSRKIKNAKPKQMNTDLLHYRLYDLIKKSGIDNKDIAIAHAFRKFFTTQLIQSGVKGEIREMLLGHKIGLASAYYRPTEQEMYSEYEKAIDNLTINEENRLKRKVEILTIDDTRLARLEKVVQRLSRVASLRQNLLDSA